MIRLLMIVYLKVYLEFSEIQKPIKWQIIVIRFVKKKKVHLEYFLFVNVLPASGLIKDALTPAN